MSLLGINAHTIRLGNATAKGYTLNDFTDAISRFLNNLEPPLPGRSLS